MVYYRQNGIGAVGSYQVSGVPYLTGAVISVGAEQKIEFPTVAKSILIVNKDLDGSTNGEVNVSFNATGSGNVISGYHYIPLNAAEQNITLNVKCKEIYISSPTLKIGGAANTAAEWFLVAELTGIDNSEMFELTGTGLTE